MVNITFFHTEGELSELTGLAHNELWDNDFCLDDWDWGFCCDEQWTEDWDNAPYEYFLLNRMDNYCCGYHETKYNGKWYYLLYHA